VNGLWDAQFREPQMNANLRRLESGEPECPL
jgi:hypothetical protein